MRRRVKIKANCPSPYYSPFWLGYFLFSISMIGSFFAYAASAPLYLISAYLFKSPSIRKTADRVLNWGIYLLMQVQPWLNAKISLQLPKITGDSPLLLISNHRSHLDAFILLSRIPGVRIFARKSLFYVPLLGTMMRLNGHIPAERGNLTSFVRALDTVRSRLKKREIVHIFPEMKRCALGYSGTQDFLSAPFLVAIQEKATIVPIVFIGTDEVWPKGTWGIRSRFPVTVDTLPPIAAQNFSSAIDLRDHVQSLISQRWRSE